MKHKRIRKSACVPAALRACGLRTSHMPNKIDGWFDSHIYIELFKSPMKYKWVFNSLYRKLAGRVIRVLSKLRGRFLVLLNDHAFAVVNGIVYDTYLARDLKRVQFILEIRDGDFPDNWRP